MSAFELMEFIGYSVAIISIGFKFGTLYAHLIRKNQETS